MTHRTFHGFFRMFLVCALGASLLQSAPAGAEDYSDIWWAGPAESGWGVNLIQSQDTIFATFFVHGPAPSTTEYWYVATLARTAGNAFTGDLYQTTGTGIGAPWNPAQATSTKVGTATFTPTSSTSGSLIYNVGAVVVSKSIVRQTLTGIALGGQYYGTAVVVHSGCRTSSNNGTVLTDFDALVAQNTSGQFQLDFTYAGSESCTFAGFYAQQGLLFSVPATYVCKNGSTTTLNTTATIYEMKATSNGLEGRWTVVDSGDGCQENGKFATVFPD